MWCVSPSSCSQYQLWLFPRGSTSPLSHQAWPSRQRVQVASCSPSVIGCVQICSDPFCWWLIQSNGVLRQTFRRKTYLEAPDWCDRFLDSFHYSNSSIAKRRWCSVSPLQGQLLLDWCNVQIGCIVGNRDREETSCLSMGWQCVEDGNSDWMHYVHFFQCQATPHPSAACNYWMPILQYF